MAVFGRLAKAAISADSQIVLDNTPHEGDFCGTRYSNCTSSGYTAHGRGRMHCRKSVVNLQEKI